MLALRPDLLEGAPLAAALHLLARRWSWEHEVPALVRVTGEPVALHPDTEAALLRTAQEALTDVAKHAGATRAVVTLSYLGDTVTLDVDDDGVGVDVGGTPAPRTDGGYDLIGMRERITALGAIARSLSISEGTVKTHLVHVFGKLGVDDRTATVTAALARGLIHLDRPAM